MKYLSACSLKLCPACEAAFEAITRDVILTLAILPHVVMQDTHRPSRVHIGDSTIEPFPLCKRNGIGWSFRNYETTERPVNCTRCLAVTT